MINDGYKAGENLNLEGEKEIGVKGLYMYG